MLNFPKTTEFGRRIPKQKFYEHLDVTPELRRMFVDQVKLITWQNKLSAQTMNLAPGQTVTEIEVFRLRLQDQEIDPSVLRLMDKQIPYHILLLLERDGGEGQLWISYKEASQTGSNAFQLRQAYHTSWMPLDDLTLELHALDMDGLDESIVRQIAGDAIAAPAAESLKKAVEQTREKEKLQRQIEQLKAKMKKEKQLGKQMELRRELKKLEERGILS